MMNKEIRMTKKSKREINAEQRARQKRVRDEARDRKRPSRDDLARMLLWKMIMSTEKYHLGRRQALDRLRDKIVDGLELQGFDVKESEEVFEELAARYADGLFPFRPKRHLKPA
jgi:CII-binding regulator of phage lambda lysogenization HflD